MGKKKTATKRSRTPRDTSTRINLADYGIELSAVIEEIRPYLSGTRAEISERAGAMTSTSISNVLNGSVKPSLGAVAALAHASGGRIIVKYEPPAKAKAKR